MAAPQLRVIIIDFLKVAAEKRILDLCQHVREVRIEYGMNRKHNGRDFVRRTVMDELKELEQVGEVIFNRKCHTCTLVAKEASPLHETDGDGFVTYQVIFNIFGNKTTERLAQTIFKWNMSRFKRQKHAPPCSGVARTWVEMEDGKLRGIYA